MKTYYHVKVLDSPSQQRTISELMKFLDSQEKELQEKYSFLITGEDVEFKKIAGPDRGLIYSKMGEHEVLTIDEKND